MLTGEVIVLSQRMLVVALMVLTPVIVAATVVGLVWALFQAVTQLQDSSASFAIKLVVVSIVLALSAEWIGGQIRHFGDEMFAEMLKSRRK
jgi:type III secretory pathway component EscS